jgi:hypothetical protein
MKILWGRKWANYVKDFSQLLCTISYLTPVPNIYYEVRSVTRAWVTMSTHWLITSASELMSFCWTFQININTNSFPVSYPLSFLSVSLSWFMGWWYCLTLMTNLRVILDSFSTSNHSSNPITKLPWSHPSLCFHSVLSSLILHLG